MAFPLSLPRLLCCAVLAAWGAGCSPVGPGLTDGGVDAGPAPCVSPGDCRAEGAVCRQGFCQRVVPCADDVECGLGERCVGRLCRFTGCAEDGDCATGRCRLDTFTCAECGSSEHCPADRPICEPGAGRCVSCQKDEECSVLGAPYCQASSGRCLHCQEDVHCPNGLSCRADGLCVGAKKGMACPAGVACDQGLMCVQIGGNPSCQLPCSLYVPSCPANELCLKLTFADSNSLVFDRGEPLGICHPPFEGLRYYREVCTTGPSGSNCQPNLECVPESATVARCRSFCKPEGGECPPGEVCHAFAGDYAGHRYGLCYPDNGLGQPCVKDADCRAGLACVPGDDPSASQSLSPRCAFKVGEAPALAPCHQVPAADGGVLSGDAVCASGACRADPQLSSAGFFCYGACQSDADCSVDGRVGRCDVSFSFPGTNVTGSVKGCRPRCASAAGCAEYGPQFTCRGRVEGQSFNAEWVQSCGPWGGAAGLGQSCVGHEDCASGYCAREDGRGVLRQGVCSAPCAGGADCAADAGLGGTLGCEPTAILASPGFDGVAQTGDDRLRTSQLCAGQGCLSDADCGPSGRCVPEVDPQNLFGPRVLRCRPPSLAGAAEGGELCLADADCASGACLALQPPSIGAGKRCFMACTSQTSCPQATTCRTDGMTLGLPNGASQSLTSCAP